MAKLDLSRAYSLQVKNISLLLIFRYYFQSYILYFLEKAKSLHQTGKTTH